MPGRMVFAIDSSGQLSIEECKGDATVAGAVNSMGVGLVASTNPMLAAAPGQTGVAPMADMGCGASAAAAPAASQPVAGAELIAATPTVAAPAGSATAAQQALTAIEQLVTQREQNTTADRAYLAATAKRPDGAMLASMQTAFVDSEEATTRRLKGLATIVKMAGQLTDAEAQTINQLLATASTTSTGVEDGVVAMVSQLEARMGLLSSELAGATTRIGQIVADRQRQVREAVIGSGAGAAASMELAAKLYTFNDITNQIGTTMVKVQQLGPKVQPMHVAALDRAVTMAQQPGADVGILLQTLDSIVLVASNTP